MPTVTIPLDSQSPEQVLTAQLGERDYRLRLAWHERDASWYLRISEAGLSDAEGGKIAEKRLVVTFWLFPRVRDARMPAGVLHAIDTSGKDQDPGESDLGTRVILVFTPAEEVLAALA